MDDTLFIAIIVMLGVTAMGGGGALISRGGSDYESSSEASGMLFVAIILFLVTLVFGAGALYVMHSQ